MTKRDRTRWLLVAIVLLATWLRFHNLDLHSFWNDEGNSARLSERTIRLIIEGTASDVHPPLYYLILRGWRVFVGETEFALRSVSAFAGVLIIPLTARLARQWDGRAPIIMLAPLLVAINPGMIWYGQETRMYMLLPLLALASSLILYRSSLSYLLLLTAGLYTHYFFPIVIALHGIIMLLKYRTHFIRWLALVIGACLLYLPWLPSMLNGMGGNRGAPVIAWLYLVGVWQFLLTGFGAVSVREWLLVPLALLLIGGLSIARGDWRNAAVLQIAAGVPLIALVVLGATDAAFYKFVLLCVPPLMVLVAAGWHTLWHGRLKFERVLAVLMGGWLLWHSGTAINQQWHDPALARDDYRSMAAQIAADNHPNAAVILNAPNQWEVFTYYHQEGAPVYPLPTVRDEAAVIATLETIASQHGRLYTLYWGDAQQDPEHWVENWLDNHAFKASERWVGDVRFVVYSVGQPTDDARLTIASDIVFGGRLRLQQIDVANRVAQGDVITVELNWAAVSRPPDRYKLFVHLVDADGALVAQKDTEPTPMTTQWQPGDTHTIKTGVVADVPPGTYRLLVGWYDAADPIRRLPLANGTDTLSIVDVIIE